ncbi:MAG: hypothetical protein HY544_01040 [Candidatus Diapherotrites archaeon]|uniref:Uncharacterized protein n=1 Tax=Candidatus Iainarchaeum sp. TaxID=3101447 RepID=A0A8T3YKF3_9ARCH|nr:hypothetical protein [Candidatus Diapherotrites archaeon]
MRAQGVLFSVMMAFMVVALLSLHGASLDNALSAQDSESAFNAFERAAGKFANIRDGIVVLPANSAGREIIGRVLPFSYGVDKNVVSIAFDLPVDVDSVDAYLEAVNYFRLFVIDANYSNGYDSMPVDINTLVPVSWGGGDRNVAFVVKPQCMEYSVRDDNSISLVAGCAGFDFNSVRRIDINITFGAAHDFNYMSCRFNGVLSCPNEPYDSGNANPYLSLGIIDANCAKCVLPQAVVSAHFNPGAGNYVLFRCVGGACTSPAIDMNFAQEAGFRYGGQAVGISAAIDFGSEVGSFEFKDANVSVRNGVFGAGVSTN